MSDNHYPIGISPDTSGLKDTAKEYLTSYSKQPTITKAAIGAGAGYLLTRLLMKKHTTIGLIAGAALGALTKAP